MEEAGLSVSQRVLFPSYTLSLKIKTAPNKEINNQTKKQSNKNSPPKLNKKNTASRELSKRKQLLKKIYAKKRKGKQRREERTVLQSALLRASTSRNLLKINLFIHSNNGRPRDLLRT